MKLRWPCKEHVRYDSHYIKGGDRDGMLCPGGVFLPDDTIVIEKVDVDDPECGDCDHLSRREWPANVVFALEGVGPFEIRKVLDALAVRE